MYDTQVCTPGTVIMIFQPTIGIDVLVFLSEYLFLSLLLYNKCCGDFKPFLLLGFAWTPFSGLLTLLNFLFPRHNFLLLSFFFDIDLCGLTLLGFLVGRRMTSVKITSFSRSVFKSTWLRAWWSGKLIKEWLSYFEFVDNHRCPCWVCQKAKVAISILYFYVL